MGCAIGIFCVIILLRSMIGPSQPDYSEMIAAARRANPNNLPMNQAEAAEPDYSGMIAAARRANPNNLPMNQAEAAADPYYQPMMAPEEEERVGMPPPDGDDMMAPEEEERVGMPPPEGDAMMM